VPFVVHCLSILLFLFVASRLFVSSYIDVSCLVLSHGYS
jgi:hypothetical protein